MRSLGSAQYNLCGECTNDAAYAAFYNSTGMTECVADCGEDLFVQDGAKNWCVSSCPRDGEKRYFVDSTKQCVETCPDDKPYFMDTELGYKCSTPSECKTGEDPKTFLFKYKETSLSECTSDASRCTTYVAIEDDFENCSATCNDFKDDRFKFAVEQKDGTWECAAKCPVDEILYIDNYFCRRYCSDNNPYYHKVSAVDEDELFTTNHRICVATCGADPGYSDSLKSGEFIKNLYGQCYTDCPAKTY